MAHAALELRDITLQEALDAIAATPLVSAPGELCAYGDVSIQVAGRIRRSRERHQGTQRAGLEDPVCGKALPVYLTLVKALLRRQG